MNNLIKVLLIFVLFGGGALGFGIEYMISSPQLENLTQELNTTKQHLNTLQTEYSSLTDDYNKLDEDYKELDENTVPKEDYQALTDQYDVIIEDYQELDEELETVYQKLDDLNHTYRALKHMYEDLMEEYELRVLPLYGKKSVEGLKITLTLDENEFEHNAPVTGSIVITHEEGSPLYGDITFFIRNEFFEQIKTGYEYSIKGETTYSISGAFQWGAGRYSIGLEKISDDEGNIIADYNDLKDFRLQFDVL